MKFMGKNFNSEKYMLLNTLYQRGKVDNENVDYLSIIYKDLDTGEKHLRTIKTPKIEIYFVQDQYRNYDYNKSFIELDKTEPMICEYKGLSWAIAKEAGDDWVNFLKSCIEKRDWKAMNQIHTYPYVFGSDINIETWYRIQWLLEYETERDKPVTKQFMDIEVDSIDIESFPRDGECPINAVTIIDEESKVSYTLLLNNPKNHSIQEFVDTIDDFVRELHEAFDDSYGVFDYQIFMYDDECELLIQTFKLINTLKRDFMLIWNGGGFDIPYIIGRCKHLGLDPREVMCHKDFPLQTCVFQKDVRNYSIATKGDALKLSSYTKFIDQMHLYAATRKGQSELRSNALNYIGQHELGDEKLDYSDEANIKTLPYVNYRKFVMYNIKDVLLQYGIERKTNDVEGLYHRAYTNATDYDKVFRQTVTLRNRAYYEFFLQGNIIGNNINVFNAGSNDDDNVKFAGAIVGDPLLNSHTGLKIFGKKSMYVFINVMDMDFTAMYPSMIMAFNIERNTMIGKLILLGFDSPRYEHDFMGDKTEKELRDSEKKDNDDDDDEIDEDDIPDFYDAGSDFMDNYLTNDVFSLGSKWFGLPNMDELADGFSKFIGDEEPREIYRSSRIGQYFTEPLVIDISEGLESE